MMQADYRWKFAHNISKGRLALQFDEIGLWRRNAGTSCVYVRELSLPFNQVYRDTLYRGKPGMLLRLPAQVRFYSSFTSYIKGSLWSDDGKGMRFRFLVYSEPEDGVPLLKNWKISLLSPEYKMITASWSQITVTDYDVIGFVMSCNSTEEWAKKVSYAVGENNSTSLSCFDLVEYTRYKVHVLVQLRKRGCGAYMAYRSLYESITTMESVPKVRPSRVSSPNVSQTTAVVLWGPISRKDARGVLLGYIIELYSYYARGFIKEIKTNGTSILIDDLRPANRYIAYVRGYTAVGSGPSTSYYFATACQHTLSGEYGTFETPCYPNKCPRNINCTWMIPSFNSSLVVVIFEKFDIGTGLKEDNCSKDFVKTFDKFGNESSPFCGQKGAFAVVSAQREALTIMHRSDGGQKRGGFQALYFQLQPGNKAIYPQVDAVNATTASFNWKQLSSIQWFYVLYKPDEADQNWNVINTTSQNVTIVGLLPSTKYIAKIFGKSSSTVYWSSSLAFMTHPVCALVH